MPNNLATPRELEIWEDTEKIRDLQAFFLDKGTPCIFVEKLIREGMDYYCDLFGLNEIECAMALTDSVEKFLAIHEEGFLTVILPRRAETREEIESQIRTFYLQLYRTFLFLQYEEDGLGEADSLDAIADYLDEYVLPTLGDPSNLHKVFHRINSHDTDRYVIFMGPGEHDDGRYAPYDVMVITNADVVSQYMQEYPGMTDVACKETRHRQKNPSIDSAGANLYIPPPTKKQIEHAKACPIGKGGYF